MSNYTISTSFVPKRTSKLPLTLIPPSALFALKRTQSPSEDSISRKFRFFFLANIFNTCITLIFGRMPPSLLSPNYRPISFFDRTNRLRINSERIQHFYKIQNGYIWILRKTIFFPELKARNRLQLLPKLTVGTTGVLYPSYQSARRDTLRYQ